MGYERLAGLMVDDKEEASTRECASKATSILFLI